MSWRAASVSPSPFNAAMNSVSGTSVLGVLCGRSLRADSNDSRFAFSRYSVEIRLSHAGQTPEWPSSNGAKCNAHLQVGQGITYFKSVVAWAQRQLPNRFTVPLKNKLS